MNINEHPNPDDILRQLPEIGDAMSAACATLSRTRSAVGAELLAGRFLGASNLLLTLSRALHAQEGQQ